MPKGSKSSAKDPKGQKSQLSPAKPTATKKRHRKVKPTRPRKNESIESFMRRWEANAVWEAAVEMEEEGLIDLGDATRESARDFLEN